MTGTQEQLFSSPTAGASEAIHGRPQSPRSSAGQTLTLHWSAREPLTEISLNAAGLRHLGSPYRVPGGAWDQAHWESWFGIAEGEEDYLDYWDFVDDLQVPYSTADEGSDDTDDTDDEDDADDVEGPDDGDDSNEPAGPVSELDEDDEPTDADRDLEHHRQRLNMTIHMALAWSVIATDVEARALQLPRDGARAALGHYGPSPVSADTFPRTIRARARPFTIWED